MLPTANQSVILLYLTAISMVEGSILDPALYLSPSPPLTTTQENMPEKLWYETLQSRIQKRVDALSQIDQKIDDTPINSHELMEGAETFWPRYTSSLRGIHIPLTFHLTGTYGGGSSGSVLASSYINHGFGSLRGILAGNGYNAHSGSGLRIFASNSRPTWSGWGNGKWGHYGKG